MWIQDTFNLGQLSLCTYQYLLRIKWTILKIRVEKYWYNFYLLLKYYLYVMCLQNTSERQVLGEHRYLKNSVYIYCYVYQIWRIYHWRIKHPSYNSFSYYSQSIVLQKKWLYLNWGYKLPHTSKKFLFSFSLWIYKNNFTNLQS